MSTKLIGHQALTHCFAVAGQLPSQQGALTNLYQERLVVQERAALDKWMARVESGSIQLEGLPTYFQNLIQGHNLSNNQSDTFVQGMRRLSEVCLKIARRLKKQPTSETLVVDLNASIPPTTPTNLLEKDIALEGEGNQVRIVFKEPRSFDLSNLRNLESLSYLPGKTVGVYGGGGGTDGAQATNLAELLIAAGKEVRFVASGRTFTTESMGPTGMMGQPRSPRHKTTGETPASIAESVFLITPDIIDPDSRWFENRMAQRLGDKIPFFLSLHDYPKRPKDHQEVVANRDILTGKLQAIVNYVGGVDLLIVEDTGGDSLVSSQSQGIEKAVATPELDHLSIEAALGIHGVSSIYTSILALGVDAPKDAVKKLLAAAAHVYWPTVKEAKILADFYDEVGLGPNSPVTGKTPLALQLALRGVSGLYPVEIPVEWVVDDRNPWEIHVRIGRHMIPIVFMEAKKHISAIGFQSANR